jgi:hypothetical protein
VISLLLSLAFLTSPTAASPLSRPCPVPKHALVLYVRPQNDPIGNAIAIYDATSAAQTCEIVLPRGTPADLAVAKDGRIFVAVRSEKQTNWSTDSGHLDVIGPDGRLLHRHTKGFSGIDSIELDGAGRLFVSTGWLTFRNGATVYPTPSLAMYDASSMALIRTFPVQVDQDFRDAFAVAPDGGSIVLMYGQPNPAAKTEGRLDVLDIASGVRRFSVPAPTAEWKVEGANLLVGMPDHLWRIVSLSTGAAQGTRKSDDADPGYVIAGVHYQTDDRTRPVSDQHGPFFLITSTISRRDVASGRVLSPIVVEGMAGVTAAVDPDPALASVQPGAETVPPAFPSLEQLRRALPRGARGLRFEETTSGKRVTYLGDYARIDDPRAHALTIVDCPARLALIADTSQRSYRVVAMDDTTVDAPGLVEDWVQHLKAPSVADVIAVDISRAQLRSPVASFGYQTHVAISPYGPAAPANVTEAEYEYASSVAAHLSCGRHTFAGEPLGLEPEALPQERELYDAVRASHSSVVHVSGAPPAIPANSLLVHMEVGGDAKAAAVFDVRAIHPIDAGALPDFAAPNGYRADTTVPY